MAPIKNPATVAVLFVFLLFIIPNFTSAATGGRVGGSFFRSSSSSSSRRSSSKSSSTTAYYSARGHHAPPNHHHQHHHQSSARYYYTPRSDWSHNNGGGNASWWWWSENAMKVVIGFVIVAVGLVVAALFTDCYKARAEEMVDQFAKLSVVKLQVGLMGEAQSLQRELNRITESAHTSTAEGLNSVLTGATIALLDNLQHCISTHSSVVRKSEISDAEACFSRFSEEEADKFDDVTLVNLNSFRTRSNNESPDDDAIDREYIVVTILVATDGAVKLPTINGTRDLKKALHTLGAISSSKIMAVEVLWTPQQENDTLTESELLKGYPELRGFYEAPSEEQDEYQQTFLGAKLD